MAAEETSADQPTKRAAAKKTAAKKVPAKKAPAKKTAAKKVPAKKAPAKKAPAPKPVGPSYDLIVYGATGFVGKLIVEYLAEHAPADLSIALAGRSPAKLTAVRNSIPGAADWPLIRADSDDLLSLDRMAASTKVLISAVGPYYQYGLPVVAACAKNGTHYADLTGEVLFIRASIDNYNTLAKESGARIVHSCGFDSLPSDLGVYALHLAALDDSDGTLGDTVYGLIGGSAGVSGGTVASLLGQFDVLRDEPGAREVLGDPYSLSPDRSAEPEPGDGGDITGLGWSSALKSWVAPFVMAAINTRVVRRTNALLDYAYSKEFRYREVTALGAGPVGAIASAALTGATAVGLGAVSFGPTRALVARLLPAPGEGPSQETREKGWFAVRLASTTEDGRTYRGMVAAQGDPGYAATAMMISECALAMVLQEAELPKRAGVLTPATALGAVAIDRLRAAGMTLHAYRA